MKKTVPLKKDITFKTNIAEITSIALDHQLDLEDRTIKGNLIISGSYKINETSVNTEEFKYNIPVNIEMNKHYILDDLKITIDDFYYEITNDNLLNVSIEIGLDNLVEEQLLPPFKYEEEKIVPVAKKEEILDNNSKEKKDTRLETEEVKSLFDNFDDSTETYATYKVCIVKENDTLESIVLKYNITKEILEQYNDTSEIKIGDKLIIPAVHERN